MRIFFDTRELYFLTQYIPVHHALRRHGIESTFVGYGNRPSSMDQIRHAFGEHELPTVWVGSREDGLALYQKEKPDWVVFGRKYAHTSELPACTQTAMLYHGIGLKSGFFDDGLNRFDVRFIEGDYYMDRVRSEFPNAPLAQVGYPKLDPLFCPVDERPTVDLEAIGLDPSRPTVLYAPTHSPTSFPKMDDRWPEHFSDFNLIVKAHQLSYYSSKRKEHRRKMELWSKASNVYVVPIGSFDAAPYMNTCDLMISDLSAILLEFAGTGKPLIWNDFIHYALGRRGPLRYRFWKRIDRDVVERFHDIAVHAPKYGDLERIVRNALADPERGSVERRRLAKELIGPMDGRAGERVADELMARC